MSPTSDSTASDTLASQRPFEFSPQAVAGLIAATHEGIVLIDCAQRIVALNPAGERLLGLPAAQALDEPLERFIPERFRAHHTLLVQQFVVSDSMHRRVAGHRRITVLRADGAEIPVEVTLSAVDAQGPRRTVAALLRDLSDTVALQRSRLALRQLSARLVQTREDERRHIARELHDELGQRLTALKMDLSALAPCSIDRCASRVPAMLAMLDDTVASVRRIAADLRPMMLDDLGLNAAIQWLAGDASRRLGLTVKVSLDDIEPALPEDTAIALYRIVQEGLTNVARHAQASEVTVSLHRKGTEAVLQVQDNGVGLPPDALQREGSFGLLGIHERVQALEGRLEVVNTRCGTRLTVHLPMVARTPPDATALAGRSA